MAGGNGKRLAPLTNLRPKPLLEVGPRPLLETTIKRFISRGFTNFWLSINYLGEMIEATNSKRLQASLKLIAAGFSHIICFPLPAALILKSA